MAGGGGAQVDPAAVNVYVLLAPLQVKFPRPELTPVDATGLIVASGVGPVEPEQVFPPTVHVTPWLVQPGPVAASRLEKLLKAVRLPGATCTGAEIAGVAASKVLTASKNAVSMSFFMTLASRQKWSSFSMTS